MCHSEAAFRMQAEWHFFMQEPCRIFYGRDIAWLEINVYLCPGIQKTVYEKTIVHPAGRTVVAMLRASTTERSPLFTERSGKDDAYLSRYRLLPASGNGSYHVLKDESGQHLSWLVADGSPDKERHEADGYHFFGKAGALL